MPADTSPAPRRARDLPALAGFIALSAATWFLAAVPIRSAGSWFAASAQAPWMPPGWLFRSMWMLLYAGVAIAAWLVWRRGALRGSTLAGYCAQLGLNAVWPLAFFGLYPLLGTPALWAAFLLITALAASLAFLILRFGPVSGAAGLLLLPYFSWVVFSASLNLYSAMHN
ncbi:TspO/MBR family protein [Pseudarthrobacter sp. NPDC092439]|uniref:TspO/MBR family protein n=1 Tax=unclassified Pseudarthrobacter TaxID=2647000 RepID=UPI00380341ED